MTFKTSLRRIWEDPLHPVWIMLAMLELVVIIALFNRFVLHGPVLRDVLVRINLPALDFFLEDVNRVFWGSYIAAGGIRVSEGIAAFSGNSPAGSWVSAHTAVCISMVISYILGPSLLLWGLKARHQWVINKLAKPSSLSILIATAAGGYIVAGALLLPVGAGMESWNRWQTMKADSRANALRDGAISSVSALGFQAQQLRWMAGSKGGGPWSEAPGGITVADLEKILPSMERGIWQPGARGSMKYSLEIASRDSLTIWGIADLQGMNSDRTFRNKDGTTGNAQVRAGVTPARVTIALEN